MSVYSIKDLEHLSGIKAHTIRIWEQRYDLFTPERTSTNIRYYSDDDLKLILNIASLKNNGHKISRIVSMSQEELEEEVRKIGFESQTHEEQISGLTMSMIDMDEESFSALLDMSIDKIGFEETMTKIIYPFMRKIGILWLTNSINPAQEHFISHLVRQKLIAATDSLAINPDGPLYILYLPEGELHELGLLFANFLIRSRGARTIFFGQSVPLNALEEVYYKLEPNYVLTSLTTTPEPSEVQQYVNKISDKFKEALILVTGNRVVGQDLDIPNNMKVIMQFDDLIEFTAHFEKNA